MRYYILMTVLMSETIERLRDKFLNWKDAFESKGLKVSLKKTKVMVSSVITKDGLSKSKVDPCGDCSLRVKLTQYCMYSVVWIHSRCARVKRVTPKFSRNFTCRKCEWNTVYSHPFAAPHTYGFCSVF